MRTVSAKLAALALTAAMFSLPAVAQTTAPSGTTGATPPSAASTAGVANMNRSSTTVTPGGTQDQAGQSAQSQDVQKTRAQNAENQDRPGDNAMNSSTAMSSEMATVGGKRASKVIGMDVVNDKDQTIGKVDDILIGPNDKAQTAVISVGGFLGIDAKLVAVPFDQLRPAANDPKSLTMPNASKESLKAMPAFNYGNGA